MEERSKTIMCSVLFLDIVEYSKKSVSGQISLKERFNAFLSVAIRDVPLDDRIILDTGDGAALSFLGDVEDALQVALSLRESLRSEGAHMEPPLLVRMGINLGPVRLVKDINGQPNIVGDGINVAQRIMAFSDPGQILVSRSYYDAVSRLSHEYGEMFHYQGSRTDKHVREHEVYAIGYPGEFTSQQPAVKGGAKAAGLGQRLAEAWKAAAHRLGGMVQTAIELLGKMSSRQRAIYGGGAAAVLALVLLAVGLSHRSTPSAETKSAAEQPAVVADSTPPAKAPEAPVKPATEPAKPTAEQKKVDKKAVQEPVKHKPDAKPAKPSKPDSKPAETGSTPANTNLFGVPIPPKGEPGFVAVNCLDGSSVFVDGFPKGTISKGMLNISLDPGKHQLTITHTSKSSVFSTAIVIKTGETIRLHPSFCE